jgi:hypothetical protein
MSALNSVHTTPHPSAAEWAVRQESLPDVAKAQVAAVKEERARVSADLESYRLARLKERRDEFEAAVAAYLVVNDAAWLAAYRVPDGTFPATQMFTGASCDFSAHFDPTAAGLWPIRLDMYLGPRAGDWLPHANAWVVMRPKASVAVPMFTQALGHAAEYSHTPF